MQVCVPSTPAQIYHLLRRQMLRHYRTPLIVMSPKSLLRHKDAVSTLDELADGKFQNVIGEVDAIPAKNVKRVIACSGKVYYELVAHRREHKIRRRRHHPRSSSSIRSRTTISSRRSRSSRKRRKSSGARKSRRTRARGIGCAPICAKMRCRSRWSRMRAAPFPRRRPSATWRSTRSSSKQLIEDAFGPKLADGEMLVAT